MIKPTNNIYRLNGVHNLKLNCFYKIQTIIHKSYVIVTVRI